MTCPRRLLVKASRLWSTDRIFDQSNKKKILPSHYPQSLFNLSLSSFFLTLTKGLLRALGSRARAGAVGASWAFTRPYRATSAGASQPCQDGWRDRPCHDDAMSSSRRVTMHGAAQMFRRAMAIGATKSVSFGRRKNSVRFKISLQKVLKKSRW